MGNLINTQDAVGSLTYIAGKERKKERRSRRRSQSFSLKYQCQSRCQCFLFLFRALLSLPKSAHIVLALCCPHGTYLSDFFHFLFFPNILLARIHVNMRGPLWGSLLHQNVKAQAGSARLNHPMCASIKQPKSSLFEMPK